MDPSLSHTLHPPSQLTPFSTIPTSNNPSASEQPVNPNPFNHVYQLQSQSQPQTQPDLQSQLQPQPQSQPLTQPDLQSQLQPLPQSQPHTQSDLQSELKPQPQPQTPPSQTALSLSQASSNRHSYTKMICDAIAVMNEPGGSSNLEIARYIEKSNTNLHPIHRALITHHLRIMKNCGILTMVGKSYKLAGYYRPQSVVLALAAPRSKTPLTITGPVNLVAVSDSGSVSQPQRRPRGRPHKPKPEASQQEQPTNVQPITLQQPNIVLSNGFPSWEQPQLPITNQIQVVTQSTKRGPVRPRKEGSATIPRAAAMSQASGMAVAMKRRGRPPGYRVDGRQKKPESVSATTSVYPSNSSGARRSGRPRRVESGGVLTPAPVSPGRPNAVINDLITKRNEDRGSRVGRPIKNPTWHVTRAIWTLETAYGELKRKFYLASEKAKEILNVLTDGIASCDIQAVVQVREELEGLIPMLTVEPQVIEEENAEDATPQTEAEIQGKENGHEMDGGGEQAQPQPQTQLQPQPDSSPAPAPAAARDSAPTPA